MPASPAKKTLAESKAEKALDIPVTVQETVESLEVTETSTQNNKDHSTSSDNKAQSFRELPIFSNPLLANSTVSNSMSIKPKNGRVKLGGAFVQVLKISAPKPKGEVVLMRRMDSDLVNASSMFQAAFPAISDKMEAKEKNHIQKAFKGTAIKTGSLSGVWVTLDQAKELAVEYKMDEFMRPLLEAPSTINSATARALAAASLGTETTPEAEATSTTEETVVLEQEVITTTTITTVTETEESLEVTPKEDKEEEQESKENKEEEEQENKDEVDKEESEEGSSSAPEAVLMKRRIEELEVEVTRSQKRFRGFVAVAVGVAVASAIPQVLPYFS